MDITGIGSIFSFATAVIDKIFPDKDEANKAKLAMLELEQKGELAELQNQFQLAMKQGEINQEEAKHPSVFVSGWRPFAGWICGISLFYNFIFMPLFTYLANWLGNAPAMPALESGELMTLLFGMLGISGMRTYERYKGVARK